MTAEKPHLKVKLGENNYGKAEVNLMKIKRDTARHEIHDVQVRVAMTGAGSCRAGRRTAPSSTAPCSTAPSSTAPASTGRECGGAAARALSTVPG